MRQIWAVQLIIFCAFDMQYYLRYIYSILCNIINIPYKPLEINLCFVKLGDLNKTLKLSSFLKQSSGSMRTSHTYFSNIYHSSCSYWQWREYCLKPFQWKWQSPASTAVVLCINVFKCVSKDNMRNQVDTFQVSLSFYGEIPSLCFPVELQLRESNKRGNFVLKMMQFLEDIHRRLKACIVFR